MEDYPIIKKDKLGRDIHCIWSDGIETYRSYYGDSRKVKFIIKRLNSDFTFEVFDFKGKSIIYYDGVDFNFLDKFKIIKGRILYQVSPTILDKWSSLMV